jgi:hypothetical protein
MDKLFMSPPPRRPLVNRHQAVRARLESLQVLLVEEEYRRNAAISQFTSGAKHPGSSAGDSTFSDMRLDPAVMAQRRMSDGSIADNQDYSRRILKVFHTDPV